MSLDVEFSEGYFHAHIVSDDVFSLLRDAYTITHSLNYTGARCLSVCLYVCHKLFVCPND